jgi:hypothetical protein
LTLAKRTRSPWRLRYIRRSVRPERVVRDLGEEIKKAQTGGEPDSVEPSNIIGSRARTYGRRKGATPAQALAQHYQPWDRPTHRTPHGKTN